MAGLLRTVFTVLAWVVLFVGATLLCTRVFNDVRADVTASASHTLDPGTLEIASSLERPVRLTLFYSSGVASNLPEVVAHADRVRRVLRRLEDASGGMLFVDEVDPEPFSEAEDRAVNAGITQVRTEGGTLFFGIAGSNDVDGAQRLGYLDPALASRLEYDIARVVLLLSEIKRPRVGVYSPVLPLSGAMINVQMQGRPWAVYSELSRAFDLVDIGVAAEVLPDDLEALLIVHPKETPDRLRYAIDQAVLRGLPVVLMVDPNCEMDVPAEAQDDPRILGTYDIASSMPALLRAWGVSYEPDKVITDRVHARSVRTRRGDETVSVDYVVSLLLGKDALNTDVRAMERLETVTLSSAGVLGPAAGATTEFTPLISTSDEAQLILASSIRFSPDPQRLLRSYVPSGRAFTLGASVRGHARSAFDQALPSFASADHIASGDIRATIIADADVLADRQWIEARRVGGEIVGAIRRADNAEMLLGVLAEYVASDALLSITPKEGQVRVFDEVVAMRREAQQQFAAEEQRLSDLLSDAERRLNELGGAGADGAMVGVDQRAELERVRSTRADVRRRLREVRFNLDREIEALGTRVKVFNIVAVPTVVVLIALGIGLVRRAGRAAERRTPRRGAR